MQVPGVARSVRTVATSSFAASSCALAIRTTYDAETRDTARSAIPNFGQSPLARRHLTRLMVHSRDQVRGSPPGTKPSLQRRRFGPRFRRGSDALGPLALAA